MASILRSLLAGALDAEGNQVSAPVFRSSLREALSNLSDEKLTPAEWRARIIQPEETVRSAVRDPQTNRVTLGEDGQPIMAERVVPERILLPGVKREELQWNGLLDELQKMQDFEPDTKFGKDMLLQQYDLKKNRMNVGEVMKVEGGVEPGKAGLDWSDPEVLDSDEMWMHDADFQKEQILEVPGHHHRNEFEKAALDRLKEDEAEYIEANIKDDEDVDDFLRAHFADEIEKDIDKSATDLAEHWARENYFERPEEVYMAPTRKGEKPIYLQGNDDQGYIIYHGNPSGQLNEIGNANNLAEAKIRAYQYAREKGLIDIPNEDTEFGEWSLPGGKNYRELLLALDEGALPGGKDFTDSHWKTPNVLAHLRMKDRVVEEPFTAQELAAKAERDKIIAARSEITKKLDALEASKKPHLKAYAEHTRAFHDARRDKAIADLKTGKITQAEARDIIEGWAQPPEHPSGQELERIAREIDEIIKAAPKLPDEIKPRKKKILALEELQSGWHQKGRDSGYNNRESKKERFAEFAKTKILDSGWGSSLGREGYFYDTPSALFDDITGDFDARLKATRLLREMGADHDLIRELEDVASRKVGVTDGPFKNNAWADLSLKRALRLAVDEGYDELAWLPGRVHADRYNLAQHVSEITYDPGTGALRAYPSNGRTYNIINETVPPEKLPDYVGAEVAQRLIQGNKDEDGLVTVGGLDLEMGGEGMKAFYDKVLPNRANAILKKLNARVGVTRLPSDSIGNPKQIAVRSPDGTEEYYNIGWIMSEMRSRGTPKITPEELPESVRPEMREMRRQFERLIEIEAGPGAFSDEAKAQQRIVQKADDKFRDALNRLPSAGGLDIHSIKITDAIRDAARKGFPLLVFAAMMGVPLEDLKRAVEADMTQAA